MKNTKKLLYISYRSILGMSLYGKWTVFFQSFATILESVSYPELKHLGFLIQRTLHLSTKAEMTYTFSKGLKSRRSDGILQNTVGGIAVTIMN